MSESKGPKKFEIHGGLEGKRKELFEKLEEVYMLAGNAHLLAYQKDRGLADDIDVIRSKIKEIMTEV